PAPDACGVACRAADCLRGLDEFVGFALVVLGGVGGTGGRRLAGLVRGGGAALGENTAGSDLEGKSCSGEMAQNRIFEIKPTSTHTIPDWFSARIKQRVMVGLLPPKWVPNAARTPADSMTVISDFVQQTHNFIVTWYNTRRGWRSDCAIPALGS